MTNRAAHLMTCLAIAAAAVAVPQLTMETAYAQHIRGGGGGGFHAAAAARAPAFRAAPHAAPRFSAPRGPRVANRAFVHSRAAMRARHRAHVAGKPAQIRAHARALRPANKHVARVTNKHGVPQGRFAARFHRHTGLPGAGLPWRHAWRHGYYVAFVPWYGLLFWPYAYADIFAYTFWPYGYYPGYWAFAYDDFFDGVFWGPPAPAYAYAPSHGARTARAPRPSYASVQSLCKQPGAGVTAWPFAEIDKAVQPNDEQRALLADVKAAAEKAAATFSDSCPAADNFPITPPGRLDAMTARLEATLVAVQTVRPALEKFYASLSDEQKARFDAIGPKIGKNPPNRQPAEAQASASDCREAKPGLTNPPIERIRAAVKPNESQQQQLKQLQEAANQAVATMQAACPEETAATPVGRLEAMEKRLQAMIDAGKTLKPALNDFYASLSNEQKARFNAIGRNLASNE